MTAKRKSSKKTPQKKKPSGSKAKTKKAAPPRKRKPPKGEPAMAIEPEDLEGYSGFPVAGLGASAGGLEALEEFFRAVPADSGIAYVVVTHLHPGHASMLPELLAKVARIPVVEVSEGIRLEQNKVYVSPPGVTLVLEHGVLHRFESKPRQAPHLPIDSFFRSLAEDQKQDAVCIVLSGTGTDGTLGLKAVKGASGMAMVQDAETASYSGMPLSAIGTGLADYVLPPREMPDQLLRYLRGAYRRKRLPGAVPVEFGNEPLHRIVALLRSRTGNDFADYKTSTVRRRVERRMNVHQIEDPTVYVHFLQENPQEIDLLFKELLITVTSFFRDPAAFEYLAESVLPELITNCPDRYTFRIWVPGCSTGEEAFSLAILMHECMEELKRRIDVQIFGTDLDAEAIESARTGTYPEGIATDVSERRLKRYFVRNDSTWSVCKEIRDMVIFAPQNVINDPPFTRLDLLSCRNLLIYMSSDLQKRLFPLFHYALKPHGVLFLGPSETIGGFDDLFSVVEKKWKIYRRKETASAAQPPVKFPAQPIREENAGEGELVLAPQVRQGHLTSVAEKLLLTRFAPTSLVINERGDILYIHGRTGEYLEPAPGQPSLNILDMAREGLQIELASAIRHATTEKTEAVRTNVRVRTNGDTELTDLEVSFIKEPESIRGLLLVTLRPTPVRSKSPGASKRSEQEVDETRVDELERELQYTRETLQTTVEELETANEELKSANEELQSMNEELQSTNEELETSKEEMQSLNEELTTVNAELQSKVDDLSLANDDMQNLLNSTEIATIFLDNQLNVKRFTDKAKNLVKLIATDVGRPLADLAVNLNYDSLVEDCQEVLSSLVYKEAEVVANDGGVHLMRIRPYRTAENVIDGLVITFVDISQLKSAVEAGKKSLAFVKNIVDSLRDPILVMDSDLRAVVGNQRFYDTFRTTRRQVEGELLYELGNGQWDVPELRARLQEVVENNGTIEDFLIKHAFPKIGERTFHLNARMLGEDSDMILLAIVDKVE